jgi:hypothetical protein
MKKLLSLFFLVLAITAFNSSCKKEPDEQPQPQDTIPPIDTTDTITPPPQIPDTNFKFIYDYTIHLDQNNNITQYHLKENGIEIEGGFFTYYGDSLAVKTVTKFYNRHPNHEHASISYNRFYYLNAQGSADSSYFQGQLENDDTTLHLSSRMNYTYYPSGYLFTVQFSGDEYSGDDPYGGTYMQYDGGHNPTSSYIGSVQTIQYTNTVAKTDIFSLNRSFDNGLTGKDDQYLIGTYRLEGISGDFTANTTYNYTLNPQGYVTRCVTYYVHYGLLHTGGNFTRWEKYNYTYIFE